LEELIVGKPSWTAKEMSTSITLGGRTYHVRFAASEAFGGREADCLLALTLLPAMAKASRLKLPESVSCKLLASLPRIQDVYCSWEELFRRVTVDVPEGRRESTTSARPRDNVACFFSGGVDSFYTALKHRDEISHLILVHGCFDTYPDDQSLRDRNSHMAREVAKGLGKPLIEVETNIRSFSGQHVIWAYYHGATLFSVALLFQHLFRKVMIPATHTYADLFPWGSHPVLDPLWSTELMEIAHEGCEATRVEKVAYISKHEVAMKWLHVCQRRSTEDTEDYNCGRCEKCLRTMLNLKAVGALERCEALPHDLNPADVKKIRLNRGKNAQLRRNNIAFAQENLKALEKLGTEPALTRAVADSINRSTDLGRMHARLEQSRAIARSILGKRGFRLLKRGRALTRARLGR
jgi:hypothetical protein